MLKSKFIKSTIILIIGSMIIKALGMIIKIITTRYIGVEGIGIYMLILPTFLLFINITKLGFPVAISKMVAENKNSNKKIILSIIPISLILNLILLIIIFFISPFISKLLHDNRTLYPLLAIGFVLPFISLSCIIRSYFLGKEKMIINVISNVFEQIIRLVLIIIIIPILLKKNLEIAVTGIVLLNIISELSSIIILIFFLPKKVKIQKKDIIPNKNIIKEILNIGLPTTGSGIIGSIGYFLEPIILTFILIKVGYDSNYIINQYGIINGYVLPLLFIPSFFMHAISTALIPVISKNYANNNIKYTRIKLKQAIIFSLIIGITVTLIIISNSKFLLNLIYNTNHGSKYLTFMAPFFLIYYIQVPLTTTLQAIGKAKESMISTLIGAIIKIIAIIILSVFKIGLYSLIIASIINILIVTIFNAFKIKKFLYNPLLPFHS